MANQADTNKVILLIDIDCFYCQVEEKLNPNLQGKPVAVVQYNTWREGGIIAANYLAREKGVTKGLWCYEAKEKCPDILFATVNEVRGRADLTKYREAGKEVFNVLQRYTTILEKASVDEAYLDITEEVNKRSQSNFDQGELHKKICSTHVVGYEIQDFLCNFFNDSEFSEGNNRLTIGALICEEIRSEVFHNTGYTCSAGIAHNKMLAKLASGLHKPNAQTVFPQESVSNLFNELPVVKIKRLGGKLGKTIAEELDISYVSQLKQFSEKELVKKFEEKTGKWLYNIARGIDLEPVKTRVISKSIGCCKRFPGKNCLVSPGSVERWISELATEVSERLEKDQDENNRKAKQLVFSFTQTIDEKHISRSKTLSLNSYQQIKIARDFQQILNKSCLKHNGDYNNITFLGLSAVNFQDIKYSSNIKSFLEKMSDNKHTSSFQKSGIIGQNKNTRLSQLGDNSSTNQFSDESKIKDSVDDTIAKLIEVDSNIYDTRDNSFREQDTHFNNQACSNQTFRVGNEAKASTSFFNKYFRNNPKSESSDNIDESTDVHNSESSDSHVVSENILNMKTCPKCQENILVSDFSLHLDKHSASIFEENITCHARIEEKFTNANNSIKNKKRKAKDTPSVMTLFKNLEELNEHNSNYCKECNKRVKLEDVLNHDDYHIALQIHHQLNSYSPEPSTEVGKIVSKNNKGSRKQNLGNIENFFKYS